MCRMESRHSHFRDDEPESSSSSTLLHWNLASGTDMGRGQDRPKRRSLRSIIIRPCPPRPEKWSTIGTYALYLLAAVALACAVVYGFLSWRFGVAVPAGPSSVVSLPEENPRRYTVRMNTFRRNDLLKRSAEHMASCEFVHQIQVVWSDQDNDPPAAASGFLSDRARAKVVYERHGSDSLSNRFDALIPVETEGVLSVDDDLLIPCADLDFAFRAWQASPRGTVGFVPRLISLNRSSGEYRYRSWWYVWWAGVYNAVLTKACFLHRDLLGEYVRRVPPSVLAYIDEHRNCEDIAMSFVAAQVSPTTPPLWVKGRLGEIGGSEGISKALDHFEVRSQCVDFFAREFGGVPLVASTAKVQPARDFLFWS